MIKEYFIDSIIRQRSQVASKDKREQTQQLFEWIVIGTYFLCCTCWGQGWRGGFGNCLISEEWEGGGWNCDIQVIMTINKFDRKPEIWRKHDQRGRAAPLTAAWPEAPPPLRWQVWSCCRWVYGGSLCWAPTCCWFPTAPPTAHISSSVPEWPSYCLDSLGVLPPAKVDPGCWNWCVSMTSATGALDEVTDIRLFILCSTPCLWLWSSWRNSSPESLDSFFVTRWCRKKQQKEILSTVALTTHVCSDKRDLPHDV